MSWYLWVVVGIIGELCFVFAVGQFLKGPGPSGPRLEASTPSTNPTVIQHALFELEAAGR